MLSHSWTHSQVRRPSLPSSLTELWFFHHFQPHSDPKKAAQIILLRPIMAESLEIEQPGKKGQRGSSGLPASPAMGCPKLAAPYGNWVCGPRGRDSVTCFGEGLPVVGNSLPPAGPTTQHQLQMFPLFLGVTDRSPRLC